MAPKDQTLWQLASSLEEILDTNLADAIQRNRFRREVMEKLDEILAAQTQKSNGHDPNPAEGLYLTAGTLSKVFKWLLPTLAVVGGELLHYLLPLLGKHG